MSIFYTKRVLPTNVNSSIELNYMRIPSIIVNNEIDIEGNLSAPSLGSKRKPNDPEGINHEIRLLPENSSISYMCDSNINQTVYYLPSTCISFHNIINNKLAVMNPSQSLLEILEDDDTNECESKNFSCKIICDSNDTNSIKEYFFKQDGVFNSIYKICFDNSYTDQYNYNHYAFIITPYVNSNITDEVLFPSISNLNNIYSTRQFEVGYDTNNFFTNVSLLYHTEMKTISAIIPYINESDIPSSSEICSELIWIGVTLFYTNNNNKICTHRHAVNMNIRSVGLPFNQSFYTPYFAKSTKELITKPIKYQNSSRSQFGLNRGCPTTSNTQLGEYDYYGNIYVGDGTLSTIVQPNNSKDLLLINTSVTLADILDETIDVYIVLLPNY